MNLKLPHHIGIEIFGSSHGAFVGVKIKGLPCGEKIDMEALTDFMSRRSPGGSELTSARAEPDAFKIISGLDNGRISDEELCVTIANMDARSSDYDNIRNIPRPSHVDYAAYMKYGENYNAQGGGVFSGRMTAPLCFAGAVCLQLLQKRNVHIGSHILSVGKAFDKPFDPLLVSPDVFKSVLTHSLPVCDTSSISLIRDEIMAAKTAQDSIGGRIECAATGLTAGIGEPMFDSLESRLSQAMFAIPAVKGIEFGNGFASSALRGSENNDEFFADSSGKIMTRTNNHGGILGGLSSGMPLIFCVAIKPTPSIGIKQRSVELISKKEADIVIKGRHDPCIVPRAVPCVTAAAAIVLLDYLL